MTKNTINIGAEPGNSGDGDTLRDAFIKTNANFDELYFKLNGLSSSHPITDTSITHDDPNIDGSIAKALLDAGSAGGGVVLVGPGTFNCPSNTLHIPENVILRGSGRAATIISSGSSADTITINNKFSGIESLEISTLGNSLSGDAIKIRTNFVHLRDILITGGSAQSWGINADAVNVCKIDNVTMGSLAPAKYFTGNGILFHISDQATFPFNYGDSAIVKVDIFLLRSNTTGIKFHGPENTNNVINNILLSQVEVLGDKNVVGCTGLHLINAKRITCNGVDLENLDVAIIEESIGTGNNVSSNNNFIATYVFGSNTSYQSSGVVNRRLFLGCDNLTPDNLSDTDVMFPKSLWLSDNNCKIEGPANGQLTISDGNVNNGLRFVVNSENSTIKPDSSNNNSSVTVGNHNTLGVTCLPGIVLPVNNTEPAIATDGMIMQFHAGVVGIERGLYQLRDGNWYFIG